MRVIWEVVEAFACNLALNLVLLFALTFSHPRSRISLTHHPSS